MRNYKRFTLFFLLTLVGATGLSKADGLAIDKVYHPYVQPLERELEWRIIQYDGKQKQRAGLGTSLSDRLFVEAYLIGEHEENESLKLSEYEIEVKWQLTEQGEYDADWGVVAELERSHNKDGWELAAGLLVEKEWGRWVAATNLWAIYEWGDAVKAEVETALAMQLRYRYSRYFEPALELYGGQDTRGAGPVFMGNIRLGSRKKIHWEAGVIVGLDGKTPSSTLRLLAEFEF